MADRRRFLETIKVIASSIKRLLDATNAVYAVGLALAKVKFLTEKKNIAQIVPDPAKPAVERRKKEFVHYSKRFSNTLKEYFKGDDANLVYIAANQLIFQTQLIVRVVREKTRHQPR
jgi:programmed cell death protein 10